MNAHDARIGMNITITCTPITIVRLNRGCRRPLQDRTQYTCTGPDGRQFKNTNKTELLQLLVRKYGKFEAVYVADRKEYIR